MQQMIYCKLYNSSINTKGFYIFTVENHPLLLLINHQVTNLDTVEQAFTELFNSI